MSDSTHNVGNVGGVDHLTIDEVLNKFDWYGVFYLNLIFWCALTYMSDSLEINLLGYLSTCSAQDMLFSPSEKSSLTSIVFAGEFMGGIVWAISADVFGRRKSGIIAMVILTVASWLSGTSHSFVYLCILRFFVGFGIGGSGIPLNTLGEFLPMKIRGASLAVGQVVWALGAIATNALAWMVLSEGTPGTWRTLTYWCSVMPTLSLIGVYFFVPESPRWLLEQKQYKKAEELMLNVANRNGNILQPFTFARQSLLKRAGSEDVDDDRSLENISITSDVTPAHPKSSLLADFITNTQLAIVQGSKRLEELVSRVSNILSGDMRDDTLVLMFMWLAKGGCYFGAVLYMDRIYHIGELSGGTSVCNFEYANILVSSTSELVGAIVVLFVVDKIGRVSSMLWTNTIGIVAIVVMMFAFSTRITLICAWFMRLSFFANGVVLIASTLEMYTTKHRVTAFALFFLVNRVGAIASTLLVGNPEESDLFIQSMFLLFTLLQSFSIVFLKETKDRPIDSKF